MRGAGNGGDDAVASRERVEFDRCGRRCWATEPPPERLHRRIGKVRIDVVCTKADGSLREKRREDGVGPRRSIIADQFDRAEQFREPRFLHAQLPARVTGQFRFEKPPAV